MSDHVDRVLPPDLPAYLVDEDRMKELLGMDPAADLASDDLIAMAAATALIQGYVDRLLVAGTYTERHFGVRIGSLQLLEYPVSGITSLRSVSSADPAASVDITGWRLVRPTGIVLGVWGCEIEAVYDAGYDPMPPDIEAAFVATFKSVRASLADAAGDSGLARRVSVTGVGSVEYDYGGGEGSATGAAQPWGLLPATAVAVLNRYRAHGPVGVG
jgi:hypothetical protein